MARVVVGATFACDDALAQPLHALLDAVVGDRVVDIEWLAYGSASELSQWLHVAAPDPNDGANAGSSRAVALLVLLVRVSDLESAHPELRSTIGTDATPSTPSSLDAFADDLETYTALSQSRPPVVVLLCPLPPPVAERYDQLELRFAQRIAKSSSRVVEVEVSWHLRDLYARHYADPDKVEPDSEYYDAVRDHREHAPYTFRMQRVIALAVCRHVRRVFASPSESKKCVVLDCDNTLWGGAVAEVGALALDLSPRFLSLQRFVIEQQHKRGLVICLCSKNISADVDTAFQARREEMPLRMDEHIAAAKVNWLPKSHNIRAIADELSLGLESFIFIDDNPVECSEVSTALPMVSVIHLAADFTPSFLHHEWVFDTPLRRINGSEGTTALSSESTTEEDRERTRFYQRNRDREQFRQEMATHTAFLSSLGIRIEFDELSSSVDLNNSSDQKQRQTVTRVLQLHHRTNQFSTSTRFSRRLEAEVLDTYITCTGRFVLCARVTDRFGHYGLVSAALCRQVDDTDASALQVDTFLLSCRALNRGVEHAMMRKLAAIARRVDATRILFTWEPTERNQPAQLFFASLPSAILVPQAARNADVAGVSAANSPATNLGQWQLSVEAASRVAFLKPAAAAVATSQLCDSVRMPGAHQLAPLLTAVAARISSWLPTMNGTTQDLIARVVSAFIWLLFPRWLPEVWKILSKRELQMRGASNQPFVEMPFRTRGSLERFLLSKLQAQDSRASDDVSRSGTTPTTSIDHDEVSKFRRKARHRTKLALLDHLHEENPAIVWSANRVVDSEGQNAVSTVDMTCKTSSCCSRVARETVCTFRRCRNCCYRIQRLLHRASSPDAHVAAKTTAYHALSTDFELPSNEVACLIASKQQILEVRLDGFCPVHRNKRRIR